MGPLWASLVERHSLSLTRLRTASGAQKRNRPHSGRFMGGVAAPVIGKLGDMVARAIEQNSPQVQAAAASGAIPAGRRDHCKGHVGDRAEHQRSPADRRSEPPPQVASALAGGSNWTRPQSSANRISTSVGMPALAGQVNRDPMQFAKELNLRGVQNVGEPIAARLNEQNRILQTGIREVRERRQSGCLRRRKPDCYLVGWNR
jgi:hypothetical protein